MRRFINDIFTKKREIPPPNKPPVKSGEVAKINDAETMFIIIYKKYYKSCKIIQYHQFQQKCEMENVELFLTFVCNCIFRSILKVK